MSKDVEAKLQELSVAPEYRSALTAFLEAIRQDEKVIEEYEERYVLEKIQQRLKKIEYTEPNGAGYCSKLGGECKYMLNGECTAAVCKRRGK